PWEAAIRIILQAEAASAFDEFIESGRVAGLTAPEDHFMPYARDAVLAKDYVKATRVRGVMAREIDRIFERFDVLVGAGPAHRGHAPRPGVPRRHARHVPRHHGCGGQWRRPARPDRAQRLRGARPAHEPSVHGPRLGGEHAARRGPRHPGANG